MDILIKKHYSLEDWTFQPGNEYYLDETEYVSSPSSLCTPLAPLATGRYYVFLNEDVSGAINNGMFITYARVPTLQHAMSVFFRQTNDLSSCEDGGFGDGYQVRWDKENNRIAVYRAGAFIGYLTAVPNPALNQWHAFKVLWYSYINLNLDRIVRIQCYVLVDTEWHDCGYIEDSNPLHEGDPVNRVGFYIGSQYSWAKSYADDTQVWSKLS